MSTATFTLADLRRVDLFDDLDDDELEQWVQVAKPTEFAPGEIVVEQGEIGPGLQLLLEGDVRTLLLDGDRTEPIGRMHAPTWVGAIAVLTDAPVGVRLQAETPCRVALVEPEDFLRLALGQRAVHRRIMAQVGPVMSRITGIEQNRERLAALGTMAAGLAHELNNPAAAARRAAADMADALEVLAFAVERFVDAGFEREDAQQIVALQREAVDGAAAMTPLGALDASDAEDDLLEALEALDVEGAWRLAGPLAAAGVGDEWLGRVSAVAGARVGGVLEVVVAGLTARGLAAELEESTRRMSDLVAAVKSYAYMDRGAVVDVDLHEGLETTLTVLGHKLKHTAIEVVRDYDRTLPKLAVHGPELNQVWTNLLDNAIDALGERGTITLRTRADGACALVEISDDGPGIPPEIVERIFDPFFTTKDVGQGTGLGLDTARRIITDRHDGSIAVESTPGATTFRVRLPLPT
jgi:signal transduction histidine kinase